MRVNAVIVAAGDGRRMNSATPKVLLSLKGRPLILYTLERFVAAQTVGRVILVVPEKEMARCDALIRAERGLNALHYILQPGGARRQDSVSQGLARLDRDCEVVVIHDGAHPFVSPLLVDRCAEAARKEGAAVVGLPARDTIKMVSTERVVYKTLARECIWQIQTPQAFRTELIRAAYERAEQEHTEATDDAMLVELLGKTVVVLEGDPLNIKITVPEDLPFAEVLIQKNLHLQAAES
jgi:2-C-methyl-D-erythritol 4-phosphate cytidylyltransferase